VFISKEPLKRGQPLTSEAKDPNGSLLTGLKAKKETVKAFAFWELCFISQQFPDRRKAIFNDIDREGGAAWTQILEAATEVIKGMTTRIDEKQNPPASAAKSPETEKPQPVLHTLPRLTDPPKEGNFFAPSPKASSRQERIGEAFSTTARSYGQSADWTPTARARARDVFDRASSAMLSPERKQKLLASSQELKLLAAPSTSKPENLHPLLAQALRSPIGRLFRQTYARRLSGIVLGAPHASLCSIVDAIESLTQLLVASLQEDQYGKVQADVPGVVRLFTETVMTLEAFVHGGLDAHWTDVTFPPSSDPQAQAAARRVPDVELVLDTLKTSLADLLAAFSLYLKDIGLVGKDLRLAREAAGLVDEN
jgi:nucleoporin NDC1